MPSTAGASPVSPAFTFDSAHREALLKSRVGERGLKIERRFTVKDHDPFESIEFEFRASRITNPDGSVVFEMLDIEIPKDWSQVATDIMAQKYFRKMGVPQGDRKTGKPLKK